MKNLITQARIILVLIVDNLVNCLTSYNCLKLTLSISLLFLTPNSWAMKCADSTKNSKPIFATTISAQGIQNKISAVHITRYLPIDGIIKAVSKNRSRLASTIHFSLGEPVLDHPFGQWSHKPYALVTPFISLKKQLLNVYPQDTFIAGSFKIPEEAVFLVPRGEVIPENLPYKVVFYDASIGIKQAITNYLETNQSTQLKTKSWQKEDTRLGDINILEGDSLQKAFPKLFEESPHLSHTTHENTPWGFIDYRIMDHLQPWLKNDSKNNYVFRRHFNYQLLNYSIQNKLIEIHKTMKNLDLPPHAKKSIEEGLIEVESYRNIFEVETSLRQEGYSLLALDPVSFPEIIKQVSALRYNKEKLFDYINNNKNQLSRINFKPEVKIKDLIFSLDNFSIPDFIKTLKTHFSQQDMPNKFNSAIAMAAFRRLIKGHITSREALSYFKPRLSSISEGDISVHMSEHIYRMAGASLASGNTSLPNVETLKFFANQSINKFLDKNKSFQYLSKEEKLTYAQALTIPDKPISNSLFTPLGELKSTGEIGDGFTEGEWHINKAGERWFVKQDVKYNELQTSAEVISSHLYRFFGYKTPIIHKFIKGGTHYALVKDAGPFYRNTDFNKSNLSMNTSQVRQLKVVAAFLKDWDRVGNPHNNLVHLDENVTLIDFGGSLGGRARGEHKNPKKVFSPAIGGFEATKDIDVIYSSFQIQVNGPHPWRNLTQEDAAAIIEKFKQLKDSDIETIVDLAMYAKATDRNYMVHALKLRRDGIIEGLSSAIE